MPTPFQNKACYVCFVSNVARIIFLILSIRMADHLHCPHQWALVQAGMVL